MFDGKARADTKATHIQLYVSIIRRLETLSLGIGCNFETAAAHGSLCWINGPETRGTPCFRPPAMGEAMFRFIKRYLRTVGMGGLFRTVVAKATAATPLYRLSRKDVPFPIFLRLNSSDVATYEDLFSKDDYHFAVQKPPATIIDAGANIGLASIKFANRWPDATIVAIEPEAGNFRLLKKNVAAYKNVIPVQAALWNRSGRIRIIDTGLGNWAFMTRAQSSPEVQAGSTEHEIQAMTMDELMDVYQLDTIDILKIDIEGAEKEVFADTSAWIEKVNAIIVELHEHMKSGCLRSFYNGSNGFDHEWKQGENVYLSRGLTMQPPH
jgi:FkbM family methyltransferase